MGSKTSTSTLITSGRTPISEEYRPRWYIPVPAATATATAPRPGIKNLETAAKEDEATAAPTEET
uniref:Uncharacterized protein n=1 Tax=Cucumis sativus TaxID=3659 RepID=A0A0A0L8I1_CUCSA